MDSMQCIELSELDQLMPRLYVRWVLCFPLSATPSKDRLLDILHSGVRSTLHDLPILGGRLVPKCQDPSRLRVLVSETNDDFHFRAKHHDTAADNTFPTYELLRKANFPVSELPDSILTPPDLPSLRVFDMMPTFIRGGILLCVKCHHSVVDGVGLGLVMKTLAGNCFAAGSVSNHASIHVPSIDRSRIPTAQHVVGVDVGFVVQDQLEYPHSQNKEYAPMTSHVFKFPAAALDGLKLFCKSSTATIEAVTTHDSLTALLFASINYARSIRFSLDSKSGLKFSSVMGIAVNGRSRIFPPMHDYAGNLTLYASFSNDIQLPVEEIPPSIFTDPQRLAEYLKLAHLSSRTHKAIAAVSAPNNEYIASTVSLAQSVPDVTRVKPSFSNFFQGTDFFISSLAGVAIFEDEWWPGGFVDALRIPLKAHWDGSCGVLPAKDRSTGLDILMGAREDDMEIVKRILFAFGAFILPLNTSQT